MADKMTPGPVCGNQSFREAVSIHTKKIYDACKSKECMQDVRVYLTRSCQEILDRALSVKARNVELIKVYIDVEPVSFNRGFYTVDAKYFYKVTAEVFCGVGRMQEICGIAAFDKRCILFGSEGNVKIFSSQSVEDDSDVQLAARSNLPTAVVEVVDPIALEMKVVEKCRRGCGCDLTEIPPCIGRMFDEEIVLGDSGKMLYVTLGQFSIIRLERDIQLLMPAYSVDMPEKECCGSGDTQDPCSVFEQFAFPVDEFFPPRCEVLNCNDRSVCGDHAGCGDKKRC